jgi:signal transduction histidine kinase
VDTPSNHPIQRVADAVIAVGVGGFLVLVLFEERREGVAGLLLAGGVLLAVLQGAALWWRRFRPELVIVISLIGGLGIQLLAPPAIFPYAALFALGALATIRPPRVSLIALAGVLALTSLNFITAPVDDTLFAMAVAIAAWALGEGARNRRAAIREATYRAVTEEQARIARELHDVIAHSVSVIVVQAGAAQDVFEARPEQARAALQSIESAARDALQELRQLLALVRPGEQGISSHPQPGLDRLEELARPLRAAGLKVDVRREGSARELPTGADLSAYRIVQEALTNTLRHAGATHVSVTLRYGPGMLDVDVQDDGQRSQVPSNDSVGRGIVGMRERASLMGGSLEAGPLPDGGYRVHARIPLEEIR